MISFYTLQNSQSQIQKYLLKIGIKLLHEFQDNDGQTDSRMCEAWCMKQI